MRTGSISRGAALAHLAVGAARKRIADLDEAVDSELFERHSRGVTLTLAGQALHPLRVGKADAIYACEARRRTLEPWLFG